jgi:hypothetical protein
MRSQRFLPALFAGVTVVAVIFGFGAYSAIPSSGAASSGSKRAKIEAFLSVSGIQNELDVGIGALRTGLKEYAKREVSILPEVPPRNRSSVDKLVRVYHEEQNRFAARFNPAAVNDRVVNAYDKAFTEQQLDELLMFYRSTTGMALRNSDKRLHEEIRAAVDELTNGIAPQSFALTDKLKTDVEALRAELNYPDKPPS